MTRIAVAGAGIAGLSAAWLLAKHHHVTLYEANAYLGGHTHTVEVTLDGIAHPVDTGFLVYNDRTYPNLIALFQHLGVRSAPSNMSFSVRLDSNGLEWAGSNLASIFAQKRNLVNPEFWRMLKDILRFNRASTLLALRNTSPECSLGEFLERGRYGRRFREWYLLPMAAAIWSCPMHQMLEFPLCTFIRFCHNHGLLQVANRPQWRTVLGGGGEYVKKLARGIQDIRLRQPVTRVTRHREHVEITAVGKTERFDQIVLACHSNQALALLADADETEKTLLAVVRYQNNHAILHTDANLLPRSRQAWSSWNYLAGSAADAMARPVSVNYLINMLQPLPFKRPVIVTLNPHTQPVPEKIIEKFDYAHPIFDRAAIYAQDKISAIQGQRRTWFCGAWLGYGFHEDGLKSALAVANRMGVSAPWQQRVLAA
ncbi:MAG: NAD(P)/FAD-dependent oxidoreductase, partial [Burkholderiales bacterium]